MAERTVAVRLLLEVQQWRRGATQAAGDVDELASRAQRAAKRANEQVIQMGGTLTRSVTLPVLAAGTAVVKLGVDFDTTFRRMQGLAGVTADEVAGLREEVLQLAGETAQSPQALAEALYFVRSSGIDGAAAMETLEVSAKGATVGLGEAASVADLVTSALGAYGEANLTAARAGDILVATAREGKAEAASLAPQMGRLLPVAAELGVSFEELGGSIAFMSRSGGGAELASTNLQNVLQKLLVPAQEGITALEQVGLTIEDLRASIADRGLLGTLVFLRERLEANGLALGDFSRDAQFTNGVLALTRDGGRAAAEVFDGVADSVGAMDSAFDIAAAGPGFQMKKAFADLQVAAIEAGDTLVPIVANIAEVIGDVVSSFTELPAPAQQAVLGLLGIAAAAGPIASLGGRVVQLTTWLRGLGAAGAVAASALGPIIAVATVATVAWTAVVHENAEAARRAKERTAEWTDVIENQTGVLRDNAAAHLEVKAAEAGVVDDLNSLGVSYEDLTEAISGDQASLEAWADSVHAAGGEIGDDLLVFIMTQRDGLERATAAKFADIIATDEWTEAELLAAASAGQSADAIEDLERILADGVVTQDELKGSSIDLGLVMEALGGEAVDTAGDVETLTAAETEQVTETEALTDALDAYMTSLKALTDPIFGMVNASLTAQEAQLAYAEALASVEAAEAAVAAAVAEHGEGSTEAEEATRGLQQANLDLERALYGTAEASVNLDGASQALATAVANGETSAAGARAELERMAAQSGMNQEQIDALIGRFEALVAAVDGRVLSFTITERRRVTGAISPNTPALGVAGSRHAVGGVVMGPGSITGAGTDTVPALLTPGEFVIDLEAAAALPRDPDAIEEADGEAPAATRELVAA